jgi:hypothetical protein
MRILLRCAEVFAAMLLLNNNGDELAKSKSNQIKSALKPLKQHLIFPKPRSLHLQQKHM